MNALFAYGTLLFPAVLRAVAGSAPPSTPATLDGFERRRVAGELFPAIVEAPGQWVEGVLYSRIDDRAWQRLDAFEGDLYEWRSVVVTLRRGRAPAEIDSARALDAGATAIGDGAAERDTLSAITYVLRRERRHRLSAELWDPCVFARDHLAGFVARLDRASR